MYCIYTDFTRPHREILGALHGQTIFVHALNGGPPLLTVKVDEAIKKQHPIT